MLLTLPGWAPAYLVFVFLLFFLYLTIAEMWNLLAGFCGLVSLGQQIFLGVGGYMVAVMSVYYGMNIWLALILGGFVAVLFALVVSIPLFRMRGDYFAIASLVVGQAVLILFSNWPYVRQGVGFMITASYNVSTNLEYYVALVIGVGSVALLYALLHSGFGLGLMAMRDDEVAAETLGVKIFRSKLYSFLIAAFVTGVAGGALYIYQVFIQPNSAFGMDWIIAMLFIVIIGGIGTIEGPIIGSIIYVFLQQYLSQYSGLNLLILGAIAIVVILAAPRGIWGLVQERLTTEILSPRRR